MKKIRILILGMSGNVSQGILKAIRNSGLDCYIVGACVIPGTEGLYLCDRAYTSPYADAQEFLPWLFHLCVSEKIEIVFSGVEEIIDAISPVREGLLHDTGAIFRASAPDKLEIGRDKFLTCRWLEDNAFPAPACRLAHEAGSLPEECGYPLIAKPRFGKGSSGVFLIENQEDLRRAADAGGYVVQEYIGDAEHEYTVGCYRGLDGFIPAPIIMRRTLKNGTSWKVEVVEDSAIQSLSRQICDAFQPDGPLNIQLRVNKSGVPVPFELNVRFSGTTPMRAQFGFCDVKAMLLESVLRRNIEGSFSVRRGKAFRYVNELYVMEGTPGREEILIDATGSRL